MSRLEEKLIELGYEQGVTYSYSYNKENKYTRYVKEYGLDCTIVIELLNNEKVHSYFLNNTFEKIEYLNTINLLKRVFNIMQKDLEVLKEYEK